MRDIDLSLVLAGGVRKLEWVMKAGYLGVMDEGSTSTSKTNHSAVSAIATYRALWNSEIRPELVDFVARYATPLGDHALAELIKVDLDLGWRRAEGLRVEDYLRHWPRLKDSRFRLQELVEAEFRARGTFSSRPSRAELRRRFPRLVGRIDIDRLIADVDQACIWESIDGNGRYFLIRRVGVGGMGSVFSALDRERESVVALKTFPQGEPQLLYRFKREFRALTDIVHPNLVPLYELVAYQSQWFITMQLIDGTDLLSYFGRGTTASELDKTNLSGHHTSDFTIETIDETAIAPIDQIELPALSEVLQQLVEGLMTLHDAGVVHRDVKPSNVLVDRDGHVTILDFGLIAEISARAGDSSVSSRGSAKDLLHSPYATDWTAVGTPTFMSPEQARERRLTPAADWYSVGVILYILLTGRPPFRGAADAIIRAKCRRDPPAVADLRPDSPRHLAELCQALLHRDPRQRADGLEIVEAIHGNRNAASTLQNIQEVRNAPFAGRKEQFGQLEAALNETARQAVVWVDVSGPSGMGKTSLVTRFLDGAVRCHDMVVLRGCCYENESVPYKALDLLIDSLSTYLAKLPSKDAGSLIPHGMSALARLFPTLRRVEAVAELASPGTETDAQNLRRRAMQALQHLLLNIGRRNLLVLCIDDMQWDDSESAAVLSSILSGQQDAGLLLITTVRSDQRERSNSLRALADLHAGDANWSWRQIHLKPLPREESEALVRKLLKPAPHVSPELVAAIAQQSGGAPFYIHELARFLLAMDQKSPSGLAECIDLHDVLCWRIKQLPRPQRRLLEILAVAGQPLALRVALRAARLDLADRQTVLELRSLHLLCTFGPTLDDSVDLFHDDVRRSILSLLPSATRQARHRQLARALERLGGDREFIASHFHRAGYRSKAARYYSIAADRAARALAFERAVRLYQQAIDLSDDDQPAVDSIRCKLASAFANSGRSREAAEIFLSVADASDQEEGLNLRRQAAYYLCASGDIQRGRAEFASVLAEVGMRLPKSAVVALAGCVLSRFRLRVRGLGFRRCEEREISPRKLAAIDTSWSTSVGLTMIDTVQAADLQARNLLLALRAGEPYRIARALAWQACFTATLGHRSRHSTHRLLVAAEQILPTIESPHAVGLVLMARGIAAFFLGQWARGRAYCDEGEQTLREHCTDVVWERNIARAFALWSLYYMGDVPELMKRQPDLLREAQQRGDLLAETNMSNLCGTMVALAQNDPDAARDRLNQTMQPWNHHEFRAQHFTALASRVQIELYESNALAAWGDLQRNWLQLRRSMLLQMELIRLFMFYLRGCCAIAASQQSAQPASLRREARGAADKLARERAPRAAGLSQLLTASLADADGDRQRALKLFTAAATQLEDADMPLYAFAARLRQGELTGGKPGGALIEWAEQAMNARRIVNSQAMARVFVPASRIHVEG